MMKYYRVKPEHNIKTRYKWNRQKQAAPAGILIRNELYTATEYRKLANDPGQFEEVEINKNNTYKVYGTRRFEA